MLSKINERIGSTPERLSRIVPHLCGMPKRLRDKSLVVAMRAFFDESAVSPKDGPFMIMAGFAGTIEDFEKTSDAWQAILDERPDIPYFHHKDRNCSSLINPLAEVVRDSGLQGFVITIPHAPFAGRNSKISRGLIGTRVYDYAFISTVKYVLWWVYKNFAEGVKVDFIFEKRRELQLCIDKLYTPLSIEGGDFWDRAGSCTPEEDKRIAALQMSDLLAGQSLESIKIKRKSEAFQVMESKKKIFIINEKPHKTVEQSLWLYSIGKILYDAGMKKILDWPKDTLDPALYEKEYRALLALSHMAQETNNLLVNESKEQKGLT